MHNINVKVMDTTQCKQTLEEKFKDSLPNYSANTLCGFSDIDQCKVFFFLELFLIGNLINQV